MEDGSIEYSQSPCHGSGESIEIKSRNRIPEAPAKVCETAQRFARILTRIMREGHTYIDVLNEMGGPDEIAPGVNSLINQVFSYRHNTSMSSERIGYLAMARCKNGAFGELGVEDFPKSARTHSENGEFVEPRGWPDPFLKSGPNENVILQQQRYHEEKLRLQRERNEAERQEAQRREQFRQQEQCDGYQTRLERLREQMRDGYTLRNAEHLRSKESRLRENIGKYCKD
jgi:hypothetical protein